MPAGGDGSVPEALTRFVGREEELGALAELLDRARLVTLVGAPGCGKTRLAARTDGRFADGARFVGLASVRDGSLVPGAVAAGAGVGEEPGVPIDRTLRAALSEARLLLVLDNCEHLVDAAAHLAGGLLPACPGIRVVATSRTPLGVRRLDGLPLAIELAAAWSRVLSAAQIRERLESELPLPDERNRTMTATVDWSYRLLPAGARVLFDRVSVFAGGFDLTAAQRVAGSGMDVLADVTALVDHSLVLAERAAGGVMRYRLLGPVRQCAARMLDARGGSTTPGPGWRSCSTGTRATGGCGRRRWPGWAGWPGAGGTTPRHAPGSPRAWRSRGRSATCWARRAGCVTSRWSRA